MSKLTCECGFTMSDSGDANGIVFSLLYDVDDFHLSEALEDYYNHLPKDIMLPWRIKSYFCTPLHLWRCPSCKRLYVFNIEERHKLSNVYYPTELVRSGEVMASKSEPMTEAQRIWDAFKVLYPNEGLEDFISLLAHRGYSKMECIKAISEATGCNLGEAKNLVHLSPAFEYRRAADETFHDEMFQTLEQLQGEPMTLRPRAVAILYNAQNQVLLMLRRKNGKVYATLPGGGIEAGETPAGACAREVLEEVNLVVQVGPQVAEWDNLNSHEHYFLTQYVSGEMRLGDGPEGIRQSAENHYEPAWIDLDTLEAVNLVPEQARELVRGCDPSSSFADSSP